ncbi:MAG: hypothetical protein WCD47_16305 [Candidatus Sulfotelmatobacter sp.]
MKYRLPILTLAFALATCGWVAMRSLAQDAAQAPAKSDSRKASSIPLDQQNAHQARELLNQAIQALGGQAYLSIHDLQEQGRVYSFYHGRPSSNGVFFWRFVEFPDKERIELTPERDIAYIYIGNKGYEITYKGSKPVEQKDLDDYLRRKRFSLETVLRTWVNDPKVALFFEGAALAGNLAAQKVTLINSKDEAVSLYFDIDTHLPIEKSYSWRDPVDREKNVEEETYNGYRLVQGVMTPFGFTRYFNGDMQTERFITSASYSETLDEAMFDPNSGYNPLKAAGKHKK